MDDGWIRACAFDDLGEGRVRVVQGSGRVAAVFREGERVFSVDNRCPHLGFPLSKGGVSNGILTCPWHAWQFDAAGGGCFTAGGTDVRAYPCERRGADVFVRLDGPGGDERLAEARTELNRGIERSSTLRLAKSTFALLASGAPPRDLIARGAALGARYRRDFSVGLSVLAGMSNVIRDVPLDAGTRTLALVHGLRLVSQDIQATPHRRAIGALPRSGAPTDLMLEWFRGFVHDREEDAAERVLSTLILQGQPAAAVESFLHAAITDHVFLDEGHAVDYTNKAFELLGHVGWEMAPAILPTLIHELCQGKRHEEDMTWKRPHDLVGLSRQAADGMARPGSSVFDRQALIETLLGDDPQAIADRLAGLGGAPLSGLASAVAEAAAFRLARFHTRNEFTDWNWAHHVLTTAEAVRRMAVRAPSPFLRRAVTDGAMAVFLARFLNTPKHPLPTDREPSEESLRGSPEEILGRLADAIGQRRPDDVALPIYAHAKAGYADAEIQRALVIAALREDHGFHGFQAIECALGLHRSMGDSPDAWVPLVAGARFLAAHSATPRWVAQTVDTAIKLQRGEVLHEEK